MKMETDMADEQKGRTMRSAASVPNIHDQKQAFGAKKRSAPMTQTVRQLLQYNAAWGQKSAGKL